MSKLLKWSPSAIMVKSNCSFTDFIFMIFNYSYDMYADVCTHSLEYAWEE